MRISIIVAATAVIVELVSATVKINSLQYRGDTMFEEDLLIRKQLQNSDLTYNPDDKYSKFNCTQDDDCTKDSKFEYDSYVCLKQK